MAFLTTNEAAVTLSIPTWKQFKENLAESKEKKAERKNLEYQLKTLTAFADKLAACHDDLAKTFGNETRFKAIVKKHGV